ncbi:MAG: hypothetical protein DCC75_00450 [Proteobacteria bacterium]|nr:MAG: hypothetical protein DCC75_00450 [Pseudomonadota bacterium]
MRIAIAANKCLPFHAASLEEQPLGGTETAVIRLAQQLAALSQEVSVYTGCQSPPPSVPSYFQLSKLEELKEVDILIAVRDWMQVFLPLKAKRRFFWTGDSYDQLPCIGIGDVRVHSRLDALLAVSSWHALTVSSRSGFPIEKTWVIRNGVYLPYFQGKETRHRKRLIYSSTPYRGLQLAPELYSALREKHPELELHIFSGYEVYGGAENYDKTAAKEFEALKARLSALPGCTVHGNRKQSELAREFMKSSLLFYPNTFEETSCMTAMEAQAAGCAIVTSDMGALPETVGDAGILVPGKPGSPAYNKAFIEAADQLLSDDNLFQRCSEIGIQRAKSEFDWGQVAARFLRFLEQSPLEMSRA